MERNPILIADAGGTKTQWFFYPSGSSIPQKFETTGINASVSSDAEIKNAVGELETVISGSVSPEEMIDLYFYGAGCNSKQTESRLAKEFGSSLLSIHPVEIRSDLEGAARALFGKKKGIACILGTGSASGLYNGEHVIESVPSLGYVLGDEGSGAFMGKRLLNLYFKRGLSEKIKVRLEAFADMSIAHVIECVYRKPAPNKYLGSFVPFLKENEKEKEIEDIIKSCLKLFFNNNVLKYDNPQSQPIGFVGGVAHIFSDQLELLANDYNLTIEGILNRPIDRLGDFILNDYD